MANNAFLGMINLLKGIGVDEYEETKKDLAKEYSKRKDEAASEYYSKWRTVTFVGDGKILGYDVIEDTTPTHSGIPERINCKWCKSKTSANDNCSHCGGPNYEIPETRQEMKFDY